jgi:transposase-like protein
VSESKSPLPKTLIEAIRYFSDPDVCNEYVAALRWPDGPVCPRCGGTEHSYVSTRRLWKCKGCKRQFSVKVGSIFEDSPIGLDKWLAAIWMIANSKNGISSHELARSIGVTQKTAWFLLHRIRLAMQTKTFDRLTGEVEVDETFVGGRAHNMHTAVRRRKITGTGATNKTIVAGTLQRGEGGRTSRVSAEVVPDRGKATLQRHVRERVEPGAALYSDLHHAYKALGGDYDHGTIDHVRQYVDGRVHTNGIECFWALLKRGLSGTYVSVQPWQLFRYVDERCFAFNERHLTDLGRFSAVLAAVAGKRLTYAELTDSSS